MSPVSSIPKADRGTILALSVTLDRLDELSPADHKDIVRLMQLRAETSDPMVRDAIERAIQRVITQTPTVTVPLEPPGPISGKRKLYAERVARELLRLRKEAGLTQAQLAELSTIPQSHISRLENAEHSATRITLKRLAAALKVDLVQLDPTATNVEDDDKD